MEHERLVTGSEAGISGSEQIRIALRTIVANGGIAQMQQIYNAVEAVLKERGLRLSKQGRASLRFFINKVAVKAEYVYPHDRRRPGWRIAPRGREHIEAISSEPEADSRMLTKAGDNFQIALSDVYTLLEVGRPEKTLQEADQGLEVFNRAGVILTVTAWETFIEDTLALRFEKRIEEALTPTDVQSTFNAVAQAWIDEVEGRPKPPDMAEWTGEGWKKILLTKFTRDISHFNTPNSQNVKKIFKKYLDLDVEESWKWVGMSPGAACQKLDALIELRGALVHRGGKPSRNKSGVNREQLFEMIALIEQLAWSIEVALEMAISERE